MRFLFHFCYCNLVQCRFFLDSPIRCSLGFSYAALIKYTGPL
uniref:Uncharacterized protein n=1 Tax=Rhizophora mucronata TaxID=61149 RepID=A0A2P2ILE6_RHIMU